MRLIVISSIATAILLALKLLKIIHIGYIWVFAPLWITYAVIGGALLVTCVFKK